MSAVPLFIAIKKQSILMDILDELAYIKLECANVYQVNSHIDLLTIHIQEYIDQQSHQATAQADNCIKAVANLLALNSKRITSERANLLGMIETLLSIALSIILDLIQDIE